MFVDDSKQKGIFVLILKMIPKNIELLYKGKYCTPADTSVLPPHII